MKTFLASGVLAVVLATGVPSIMFDVYDSSADSHETTEETREFSHDCPHNSEEREERQERREEFQEKVTRTVELTDTGAIITLTTDDAEVLEQLQDTDREFGPRGGPHGDDAEENGITHEVELIDDGIQITVTGSTDDEIAKIQEHANREPGERGERHHRQKD